MSDDLDGVDDVEDLRARVRSVRRAAAEADVERGAALGRLRVAEDELAALRVHLAEAGELLARADAEVQRSQAELDGLRDSTSWRLLWALGAPWRRLRRAVAR